MQSEKSVVILTREGSIYGGMVLESALKTGIPVACVIVQTWTARQKYRRFVSLARKHGVLTILFSKIIEGLDGLILDDRQKKHLPVEKIAHTGSVLLKRAPSLNGSEMSGLLKDLSPGVILLAGVGVVADTIIQHASMGVLNGHPGLVPRYRGNYVVRWALHDGEQVGVTVHLVDTGIDTGDVLMMEPIDLPLWVSLRGLEAYADIQRANLLAKAAKAFMTGQIVTMPQEKTGSEFPLYSYMPLPRLVKTYHRVWQRAAKKVRA